jgi:hypothetical protein
VLSRHAALPPPSSPSGRPAQIKKRIEDLIAREYLERDATKSNVYKYLA